MTEKISTVDELFDAIGGPAVFGRAVGITTEHASVIKQRGSIPVKRWLALIESEAGKSIGITPELLTRLHAAVAA